jgi:hypothetical protein
MKAQLIVFVAVVSLGTNQEVRKKEKIRKRSYSMSQLGAYDKGKEAEQIFQSCIDFLEDPVIRSVSVIGFFLFHMIAPRRYVITHTDTYTHKERDRGAPDYAKKDLKMIQRCEKSLVCNGAISLHNDIEFVDAVTACCQHTRICLSQPSIRDTFQ